VANIFLDFSTTSVITATQLSSPSLSPISGIFNISNTLEEPEQIIPVHTSTAIPFSDRMNFTFPAMSVTVVTMESPDFFSGQ
jgi:alpha-N-arabinofuranosidase